MALKTAKPGLNSAGEVKKKPRRRLLRRLVVESRASGDGNDSAGFGASPIPTTPLCAEVVDEGFEVDSDLDSSGLYVTVLYVVE